MAGVSAAIFKSPYRHENTKRKKGRMARGIGTRTQQYNLPTRDNYMSFHDLHPPSQMADEKEVPELPNPAIPLPGDAIESSDPTDPTDEEMWNLMTTCVNIRY